MYNSGNSVCGNYEDTPPEYPDHEPQEKPFDIRVADAWWTNGLRGHFDDELLDKYFSIKYA